MYGVTRRGHRYYCDSFGAGMQRSVHVALKAAARKSKDEWTFVCDGTVLGRADPGYVNKFFPLGRIFWSKSSVDLDLVQRYMVLLKNYRKNC